MEKRTLRKLCAVAAAVLMCAGIAETAAAQSVHDDTFRIGWISPMTGPASKYGADSAAVLAMRDVNARGGVMGKKLELIMEDGKCSGPDAAFAARKLVEVDRVEFILGGHCSTETLAIAPIVEQAKVVTLAAVSSSPAISSAGDYVFRLSASGTVPVDQLAHFMREKRGYTRIAAVYEFTPYVIPAAEYLEKHFLELGGSHVEMHAFNPGESDFRSTLAKIRASKAEAVYVAVQAQDTAAVVLAQIRQMNLKAALFGNEVAGNALTAHPELKDKSEGLVFSEAAFDPDTENTRAFIHSFNAMFDTDNLPYGVWTAESYDGVLLLADLINRCGPDKDAVKRCLYNVRNYEGVSGSISIDANGDGIRPYVIKEVKEGKIVQLSAEGLSKW